MTSDSPAILAIETASQACSAALLLAGERFSRAEIGNNLHSQVLISMVADLFSEAGINAAELDAVAVGRGPGSFTGLRIGIGVAQGIAYGADCPMLGVSSLAALALTCEQDGHVLAGLDARMGEIYVAEYCKCGDQLEAISDAAVLSPGAIASAAEKPLLVGNGWHEYRAELNPELLASARFQDSVSYPDARDVLTLAEREYAAGHACSPLEFQPVYVRDNVARKSAKKVF